MSTDSLFQTGSNCWRVEKAARVGVAVDGAEYFPALFEAIRSARFSILICGWDFNSRFKLLPERVDRWPVELGLLLNYAAKRQRSLHVHMLGWNYSLLMARGREPLPALQFGWKTHRRIHFHLDGKLPVASSLHQKFVVIDDRLAFLGGLDLTSGRWDSSEHRPDEPRRRDHEGNIARPHHDVQIALEGKAASVLGDMFRERWRAVCGERLESPPQHAESLWPASLPVACRDVDLAIARTVPVYREAAEVREVERLALDMIHAAKRLIYLENQYLTAPVIADALASRLAEVDGPEVVLVLPVRTDGWLSQNTMDLLRTRALRQLRDADSSGRFGVYYPHMPGLDVEFINVHSKLLLIDDQLLRIGSSNFNNRSMGLDIECDVALEATDRSDVSSAVIQLRRRLLAEHLGCEIDALEQTESQTGSVLQAIERLRNKERSLRVLPIDEGVDIDRWLLEIKILDPERPVEPETLIGEYVPENQQRSARSRLLLFPLLLLFLAAAFAAWQWSPLAELADIDRLSQFAQTFKNAAWAPWASIAAFVLGGLVVFPVSVLIVVTVLLLGPVVGFFSAFSGAILSALICYGLGWLMGSDALRHVAGKRINAISQRLARRGVLTIVAVRMIPVAPFTVINVAAGASHISLRDFLLGTALGMFPGTLAIAIFAERVGAVLKNPSWLTVLTLIVAFTIIGGGVYALQRWLTRRDEAKAVAGNDE